MDHIESKNLTPNFGEPKSRARHARETNSKLQEMIHCNGRESQRVMWKAAGVCPEIQDVVMAGYKLSTNLMNRLTKLPRNQVLLALDAIKAGRHPRDVVNYYISQNADAQLEEQKKRKISISAHDPEDAANVIALAWLKGKVTDDYFTKLVAELRSVVELLEKEVG